MIYRPRVTSYHRRLWAATGPLLVASAVLAFALFKRPTPLALVALLLIALGAFFAAYSVLKPSLVVLTDRYLLRGKLIGWQIIELKDVSQTLLVERLTPKKALSAEENSFNKMRFKGVPALWFLDSAGKSLMRLDGTIWDYKTLKKVASDASTQTLAYPKINVTQVNRQHPGLVTFNELHPGWRSTALALASALLILALAAGALLPESILQDLNLLRR